MTLLHHLIRFLICHEFLNYAMIFLPQKLVRMIKFPLHCQHYKHLWNILNVNTRPLYFHMGKVIMHGRRGLLSYKTWPYTKSVLCQNRFSSSYRSCKTGFIPKRVNTKPAWYQILRLQPLQGLLNPNPDRHTIPLRQSTFLSKRQV